MLPALVDEAMAGLMCCGAASAVPQVVGIFAAAPT
jgi:hypothetical protein